LVYAILIHEKPVLCFEEAAACIALAFPEQLVPVGSAEFTLRDVFLCEGIPFDWWLIGSSESRRSYSYGDQPHANLLAGELIMAGSGIHELPTKNEALGGFGLERYLLSLIDRINDRQSHLASELYWAFEGLNPAESPKFVRKWVCTLGPLVKKGLFSKSVPTRTIAVGIYARKGKS
jgi:hypothetical protein